METNALLKDLYEKKQSIRRIAREVGSMASKLREVRAHMAILEANLQQETARRMATEAKAEAMGKELEMLQKILGDKNSLVFSSVSLAERTFTTWSIELFEDVKSKNTEHLMKKLVQEDEELAWQREELRTLSAQLKIKATELQESKKRVIKLEFLLREAPIQARKLQKVAEKKDKDLKDLQTQLASNASILNVTFAASASALVLFIFMKQLGISFWELLIPLNLAISPPLPLIRARTTSPPPSSFPQLSSFL
ncbi:hypothetical protein KP509_06G058000 [Ceratopteris richardii]|uniref:Uncharacterized protein n=1 Tax=Ceratopteris richardii TaxID=49495 RepID=A0A8T2UL64_CERRI|nr:hypothetical protein KP509_06G058000 [Ceratopteris richardii]